MNFEAYKRWADSQVCVDCGAKRSERLEWVTETQCMPCWKKLGPPESRGLPGARELAEKAGLFGT